MYKNNRVALSGVSGFIGTHLREHLEDIGYVVYPIPREFLTSLEATTDFITKLRPNYIIHLGAYGNQHYQTNEAEIFKANIASTSNLLIASKDIKYKAFIYVSSSSVYGNKSEPIREIDSLDGITLYAGSKIAAEAICKSHQSTFKKPVIIARPFSIYGPGEQSHRLIPSVCRSIQTSTYKMQLNPNSMHDWLYVGDFVKAIEMLMDKAKSIAGEAFNIGSGEQHSNLEILEKIEWVTNRKANYEIAENLRPEEKSFWMADISKMLNLGWKPAYTLIRGLKKSVNIHIPEYD